MKVIVPVVNNPIFIKLQYQLLQKFMPCSFEMIVVNDAKGFSDYTNFGNIKIREEIIIMCENLKIKCINYDNSHHMYVLNASSRHADVLKNIKTIMKNETNRYMILDSDMFPIYNINIDKLFSKKNGAIVLQNRGDIDYMWPNFFFMDTGSVSDFDILDWDISPGCDSGGASQHWLKNQNRQDIYFIHHLYSCSWNKYSLPSHFRSDELIDFLEKDLRNKDNKFWCEIYDETFLHYRAGSNWNSEGVDVHRVMFDRLEKTLNSLL